MSPPKPLKRPAAAPSSVYVANSSTGNQGVVFEGWVLKKRRKRMQGFARRYFTLYQSGLLSYSFQPGQATRDQVALPTAAISTAPGRKDITIDSSTATFHIKCLTTEDFNKWMAAFRKFIVTDDRTVGRRSSISRTMPFLGQLSKTGLLAEEMGSTIAELEDAFSSWSNEDQRQRRPSSVKGRADKHLSNNVFGLFKKSGSHHNESVSEDHTSSSSSNHPSQRVQDAITILKSQHATLTKSLSTFTNIDPLTLRGSPLPSTREEENDGFRTPTRNVHTPWGSKRGSIADTVSDSTGSIWFDAPEAEPQGAEEYIIENDLTPLDENGGGSKLSTPDSYLSASQDTSSDAESDSDSEASVEMSQAPDENTQEVLKDTEDMKIVRRTQLPSPPVGDEGSLFVVLKKNVGKDLSSVALPVTFNEPLTLLQRAAEELEYYDLLTQAAQTTDPIERICYVAAFAVSSYAHTRHRSGRKGFNPMLAETFEDARMKFVAEKVSHQPVVMAYHAEGEDWELYATSAGKTKFWGKSLEIIPLGATHVKIGSDLFQWKKPSSFMRNLMMGTKYLEHCGKMIVENTTTKARCVLDFKESGWLGSANLVSGTVLSPSGQVQTHLEGKWDDHMAQKIDASHLRILWRITPFPKNAPEYYGFTAFGITLNEITPDMEGKLPPTDSRYRPDVRALEEGDLDRAEAEKVRVEELQRERRRQGTECRPRWFKPDGDEWVYAGGYWEARAAGWQDVKPLW